MPRSGRSKRARRSSKRKRSPAASESDNAATSASSAPVAGPLSFDAFLAMPEEIRSLILELAYSLPSTSNDVASSANISHLDAATTINLACTSRWFNVQATLRLYTHVAITRPSALASFQRAIALRPQLGRLIKSLHVGAWDPLPESWYPLRLRPGFVDDKGNPHPTTTLVLTSLSSEDELPEGCAPGKGWSFEHPELDRRSMAISRALLAAQKSLDVDLRGMHNWWFSVSKQKLFLVQAALDLYLIAMRRFEKTGDRSADLSSPNTSLPGGHHASPDYPSLLVIDAQDASKPSNIDNACVLTRQQLTQHLARPRGPTDRFDHPLLFARSGLDQLSETYRRDNLYRCQPDDRFLREPEDLADIFESKRGLETPGGAARVSEEVLDPSLPGTATIGGLLALTRSLLAMTPRLENLSLTGFLERAVCGRRPTASLLKSLRCLSIGPPPETSEWYVPLPFEGLEEIQKLRVCGTMLRGDEVAQISGRYSELQWSLADQLSAEDVKTLGVLVDHLIGRKSMAADEALQELGFTALRKLRLPFSYSAAQREPPAPNEEEESMARFTGGSLVEMRVRPEVYDALLDRAASDAECEAWETGQSRPHQGRRLLLDVLPVDGNVDADETRALYLDGKEWWVRHQNLGEPRYQSHQRWPYY